MLPNVSVICSTSDRTGKW